MSSLLVTLEALIWVGMASSIAVAGSFVSHGGKPFFPIGVYHYPERLPIEPRLEELANAGFNTILMPLSTSDEFLDKAQSYGIGVIATLGGYMILSSDEDPKKDVLTQHITRLRSHPAILGYEAPDEIAWVDANRNPGASLEGLLRGYRYVKDLDPDHPIWMNHAPRNTIEYLREYSEAGDILGTDIYPVPEGYGHSDLDQSLNCVAQYTEKLDQVGQGKPIYMVLQGFGWDDLPGHGERRGMPGRQPTWVETRFMAYDAVCHGANGIIYWGMAYAKLDDPIWPQLKGIASELRDLTPILLSGPFQRLNSSDPDLELFSKTYAGWNYLFVLNTKRRPLENRTVAVPAGWHGPSAKVLFEGREVAVEEGYLTDSFKAYDVHIYTDDPRPDLVLSVGNPLVVETGRETNITVRVENRGRSPSPSFNISLSNLTHTVSQVTAGPLETGSAACIQVPWRPRRDGNHTLLVRLDPAGEVDETTASNNNAFLTLFAGPSKPDLRPCGFRLEDGERLVAEVTNQGTAPSPSFTASLRLEGVAIRDSICPSLAPGEEANLSWTIPNNVTGVVGCRIVLDPDDEVDEALEANNILATTLYLASLVRDGPALYPQDIEPAGLWLIKYDASRGRGDIPPDTQTCTLVWTINNGEFPYNTPPGSRNVNGSCETPMERGPDGLFYTVIPNQEARMIRFKFRDIPGSGSRWDDNDGEGWMCVSRSYVFKQLVEFDRVVGNGSACGADMSRFEEALQQAWSHFDQSNYSQVLYDIDDLTQPAGLEYARCLLNSTQAQLEMLRSRGVDVTPEARLLERARVLLDKGLYRGAEFCCRSAIQKLAEKEIRQWFLVPAVAILLLGGKRRDGVP